MVDIPLTPKQVVKEIAEAEGVKIRYWDMQGPIPSYTAKYPKRLADDKPVKLLYQRLRSIFPNANWYVKTYKGDPVSNRKTLMGTLRTGVYVRPEQRTTVTLVK
jgi:hypothetical protein